jgi:hypothetical protein
MRAFFCLTPFLFLTALPLFAQTKPTASSDNAIVIQAADDSKPAPKEPTPTVFQAGEEDRWMLPGLKPLIFKVDPVTGSETLVVGTEEMPPGKKIPTHKLCTKMKLYSNTKVQCE